VGELAGSTARGPWIDTPYGTSRNRSTLDVRTAPNRIEATGGFAGRTWSRSMINRDTVISSIDITIVTGGDDLRGGAVAYAAIQHRTLGMLPKVNLNGGAAWGNNSTATRTLSLPAGTRIRDLAAIVLEHDGAPRNPLEGYDNWNADTLDISFRVAGVSCPLRIGPTLFPGRLTGERPTFTAAITP
jgi:hypothetical protein